jgi:hypothetical protein
MAFKSLFISINEYWELSIEVATATEHWKKCIAEADDLCSTPSGVSTWQRGLTERPRGRHVCHCA